MSEREAHTAGESSERLRAAAEFVLRDVQRSRGIELAVTKWDDPRHLEIGAAIHEPDRTPREPSWEA